MDNLHGARPSRPKTDYERRKQLRLDFFSPLDGPSDDRERLSALEIRAPSRGTAARATERKFALPLSCEYEECIRLTTRQLNSRPLPQDSDTIVLTYDLVAPPPELAVPQATLTLSTKVAPSSVPAAHRVPTWPTRSIL